MLVVLVYPGLVMGVFGVFRSPRMTEVKMIVVCQIVTVFSRRRWASVLRISRDWNGDTISNNPALINRFSQREDGGFVPLGVLERDIFVQRKDTLSSAVASTFHE